MLKSNIDFDAISEEVLHQLRLYGPVLYAPLPHRGTTKRKREFHDLFMLMHNLQLHIAFSDKEYHGPYLKGFEFDRTRLRWYYMNCTDNIKNAPIPRMPR
jgi:hypothetical protein